MSSDREPIRELALKHTQQNSPVYLADYAYKELLVGKVGLLCDAHNRVVACDNVVETAISLLAQGGFARTPLAKATDILKPLKEMFDSAALISPTEAKREIAEDLMLRATRLWRKASKFPNATNVQPLPCRAVGSISLDANGVLKGPNGTFNCEKGSICGAAQYVYSDHVVLKKLIESLDEKNLPDELKNKGEIKSRRKVLKQLLLRGPKDINKKQCRQIGDAYFAAMCPPDAHILTTNVIDFLPMCAALKKQAHKP